MTQEIPNFDITIPIYEHVNLIDVAAPVELFYWMGYCLNHQPDEKRKLNVTISLAAYDLNPVATETEMLKLTPTRKFQQYTDQNIQANLLWVPGAGIDTIGKVVHDKNYMDFLCQQGKKVKYLASVCEGAILLAQATLLKGYQATTHWAAIPCLQTFEDVKIADGYPRCVVERKLGTEDFIITGGGISSGFDEALEIISLIAGEDIAREVQVLTQYFPKPPFTPWPEIPHPSPKCEIFSDLHPPKSAG